MSQAPLSAYTRMQGAWARPLTIAATILFLSGCEGTQSALSPMADDADAVARLSWIIFIGGGVIFAVVIAFAAYATLASSGQRGWMTGGPFIIAGGVVFPVVTLSVLLVYGLTLTGAARPTSGDSPLRIEITGEQFWWRVTYVEDAGAPAFETANEIHIPVGRPVALTLKSADVIHSFWVPKLAGKMDMIPGQENRLVVKAREPGTARGQCTEYCGAQHAQMALHLVASEPDDYRTWRARVSGAAAEPEAELETQGRDLFLSAGCGACHTVRGTAATGTIGPDLSHFGGRQAIAGGVLPNTAENVALWIAGTQHLKPGNKMPPFEALGGDERRAIAAYLESLK